MDYGIDNFLFRSNFLSQKECEPTTGGVETTQKPNHNNTYNRQTFTFLEP